MRVRVCVCVCVCYNVFCVEEYSEAGMRITHVSIIHNMSSVCSTQLHCIAAC